MAVTFKLLRGVLIVCALFAFASAPTASAVTAAACSNCATDCYATYAEQVEECSWRWWCQQGVKAERDACLGNCIIDGCGDYDWFPRPEDDMDFWETWLI